MSYNLAHERVAVGTALVRFFAALRGRPLSPEEYAEARYAADSFVSSEQRERAFQREMREVFDA